MKTTKLLVAAALLITSASISFAGPGAQYWQQRRNSPASQKAQTTVVASGAHTAAKTADTTQPSDCQGCSSCKAKS